MQLLDVNLLIALIWPEHAHHRIASRWLGNSNEQGFATCAMTESAFLRLIRNPLICPDGPTMKAALSILDQIHLMPGYSYIETMPSPLEPVFKKLISLTQGYRQIPDAYLLGVAAHNGIKLATLDSKLVDTFGTEHIELIPTS